MGNTVSGSIGTAASIGASMGRRQSLCRGRIPVQGPFAALFLTEKSVKPPSTVSGRIGSSLRFGMSRSASRRVAPGHRSLSGPPLSAAQSSRRIDGVALPPDCVEWGVSVEGFTNVPLPQNLWARSEFLLPAVAFSLAGAQRLRHCAAAAGRLRQDRKGRGVGHVSPKTLCAALSRAPQPTRRARMGGVSRVPRREAWN